MKRFIAGVVVGMVLAGGVAYAQSQPPATGQDFLNTWPDAWRTIYAFGWHNGLINGILGGLNTPLVARRVQDCVKNWTYGQTRAVIENYVRVNPAQWHQSIDLLTLDAVFKACP